MAKRGAKWTDAAPKIARHAPKNEKRAQNAAAKAIKDILWTTVGKIPEWLELSDEADNAPSHAKPDQTAFGKD